MPIVFTTEWISKLQKKFGQTPNHLRPLLFSIACDEGFRSLRNQIEGWMAFLNLDKPSINKLVSTLRIEDRFMGSLNEIALGVYLKQRFSNIFYEKNIGGLTPDWYVEIDGVGHFAVELFHVDESTEQQQLNRCQDEIRRRIGAIPIGVLISIYFENHTQLLDSGGCKQVTKEVEEWIRNSPNPEESIEISGIKFKFNTRGDWTKVQFSATFGGGFIDIEPLKKKVLEKIKKYEPILENQKLPFVVVGSKIWNSRVIYFFQNFVEAVIGRETLNISTKRETGEVVRKEMRRVKDGISSNEKSRWVSAFMWIEQKGLTDWTAQTILHDAAKFEMPVGFVGTKIDL